MIPYDAKHYRAPRRNFSTSYYSVIGIIAVIVILSWMDERDREAHVRLVQESAAARCM